MIIEVVTGRGISNHVSCEVEVRQDAALALGSIGPDASVAVSHLVRLLNDDYMRIAAIDALGGINESAESASPELLKVRANGDARVALSVTIALHRIDPWGPHVVDRLEQFFKTLQCESPEDDSHWRELQDAVDLTIELGDRGNALQPILMYLVREHDFLHPLYRAEAAYALAILDAENPIWRQVLERVAQDEKILLRERLDKLNRYKANAD